MKRIIALDVGLLGAAAIAQAAPPTWTLNNGSVLNGSAVMTPAAATANACAAMAPTLTLTGASTGSSCFVGVPSGFTLTSGLIPFCNVTAANTVTITMCNVGAGTPTPAGGTYSVSVIQ